MNIMEFKENISDSYFEEYTCNAIDHINFKLVRTVDDMDKNINFPPEFAHQFYGENEKIFGYKNLQINIYFSAQTLKPFTKITYDEKIQNANDLSADNIDCSLLARIPEAEKNQDLFCEAVRNDNTKCFGKLIDQYKLNDDIFEIFHATGSDLQSKDFQNFNNSLQYLLLFFVDGSSFIDLEDPSWEYFIIYQKYTDENLSCRYATIGFMTVFNFFAYPDKIRKRISQVLIFPPFQKQGHGERILSTFYNLEIPNSLVKDITIEDPSDQFQILRDYIDCKNVLNLKDFDKDLLKKGMLKNFIHFVQLNLKISRLQINRIYEILVLKFVNQSDLLEGIKYKNLIIKRLTDYFGMPKDFNISSQQAFVIGDDNKLGLFEREYERIKQMYFSVIRKLDKDL